MRGAMMANHIDLATVKMRQQGAWATGNYAVVGTTLQIVGEQLCEAMDLRAGSRVLDVAAGNGNATLAAAHRFCDVTSTDYVPALLEAGRRRAEAEEQTIDFRVADAEALPFADGSFDAVMSTFGVMFTPDQDRAAAELLRVCRPGGVIGLANWTPESYIGQVFKLIGKYVPPAPDVRPPSSWGTEARLQELFAGGTSSIRIARRHFTFRYRSGPHMLETFRTYYGPMNRAFAAVEGERRVAFESEMFALMEQWNRSGDATIVLPSEYLEVVLHRA
jgi:SAM-dependent methyltransferase